MMTAMLCVQNILAGKSVYDLWQVNQDAEYHEAGAAGEQQAVNGTAKAERLRGTLSPPPWAVSQASAQEEAAVEGATR